MIAKLEIPLPQSEHERNMYIKLAAKHGHLPLGNILMTPSIAERFSPDFVAACLLRHAFTDFGTIDEEDWQANLDAIKEGERVLSAYRAFAPDSKEDGERLWIITEWDRKNTTVLLPEEY